MTREVRKVRHIRMRDAEWEKLIRLGGAEWVRLQVEKAKDPKPKVMDDNK